MGRINPQRRAALKAKRASQFALRLALDLKERHSVGSHAVRTPELEPVGNPKPNARGWEFGQAPKGSVKAAGHKDKSLAVPVRFGIVQERKTKRYRVFGRD